MSPPPTCRRSGIICDNPDELPLGIDKAMQLRPADCRDHVAHRFDLSQMAHGYEHVYRQVMDRHLPSGGRSE